MNTNNQLSLDKMNEQRKRNEGCDVTIQIDKKSFHCHRTILSSWSSYFKAMFDGNFAESESSLITIKNVDAEAFDEVLEGMYAGKVTITKQNVYRLLKACSFLGLHEFQQSCVSFAKENEFVDHLVELCLYAELLNEEKLFDAMTKCIAENFVKLSPNYDFSTLPASVFNAILSQPTLDRSSHVVLLEIVKWVKKNSADNLCFSFEKLMKTAQITRVSSSLLRKLLFSVEDITEMEEAIDEMKKSSEPQGNLEITGVCDLSMKVYVKARSNGSTHPDKFISLKYAPENKNKWILANVFNSCIDNLKTVCIGRQQYFLTFESSIGYRFWMVKDGISSLLSEPPGEACGFFELVELNGIIFLYTNTLKLRFYYPDINKWYESPEIEQHVKGAAFVSKDNVLCLFGGVYDERSDHYCSDLQWWDCRTSYWNTIRNIMSFSYPRTDYSNHELNIHYSAACVFGDSVYISGSSFNDDASSSQFLKFYEFQFSKTSGCVKCYPMKNMHRDRQKHVLTVFNGEIYAIDNNLDLPFSRIQKHSGKIDDDWFDEPPLPKQVVENELVYYTGNVMAAVVISFE